MIKLHGVEERELYRAAQDPVPTELNGPSDMIPFPNYNFVQNV